MARMLIMTERLIVTSWYKDNTTKDKVCLSLKEFVEYIDSNEFNEDLLGFNVDVDNNKWQTVCTLIYKE